MVQKVFGIREAKNGTKAGEFVVDRNRWAPKNSANMMKRIQTLEEGRVPAREAKNWRIEEERKIITRKEYQRLLNNFEVEGFNGTKRCVEFGKGEKPCMKNTSGAAG